MGPQPIINGEYGNNAGRGSFIKFDHNNGNILYYGAGNGGIWKANVGQDWTPIGDHIGSISSGAFAIKPGNSNIMYYGTGEAVLGIIYTYTGRGIFKTTNGGENWFQLGGGLPQNGTKVFEIVINPQNTGIIFAAMNSGLWRSIDEGVNWTRVTGSADLICTDVVISPDSPANVYCAGPSPTSGGVGYRRSSDGGANFVIVNDPLFQPCFRTELAISHTVPNVIYATTNIPYPEPPNPPSYMKIYKSTNGIGTEFVEVNCLHYGFPQVDYDLLLEVSPYDPNLLFVGDKHLFKSTQGGNPLNYIAGYSTCETCCATISSFSNMHPDFHSMDFNNPTFPNMLAVVNDGGVWVSPNNGFSWVNQNSTLATTMMYDFTMYKNNKEIVLGGVQDYGFAKKIPDSKEWSNFFPGLDGGKVLISAFDQNHILVVDNLYGNFNYTTNNGGSWQPNYTLTQNTTWYPDDGDWIAPFAEHPSQPDVIYTARRNNTGGIRVFKSSNFGEEFTIISNITVPASTLPPPQDLAIANEPNSNIMYLSASHFDAGLPISTDIFRTSNSGIQWNRLNITSIGVPKRYITDLKIDPANPNELYLTLSGFGTPGEYGHVFRSIDGGNSWSNISGNLSEDAPVNKFVVYYWGPNQSDKRFIVASDNGVWISNDIGQSWTALAPGLPNTIINDLEVHELSGFLRVSTFGRGMFEVSFETPFFIQNDYLLGSNQEDIFVDRDIHVTSGNKLTIIDQSSIKIASGKKIIVEDGGQIDVSNGVSVNFTSQSGEWGGIEFQGDSYGTLRNCTFQNTSTPVVIEGDPFGSADPPDIIIDSCNFNAPIEITNRKDVTVEYCNFNYSSGSAPSVLGILVLVQIMPYFQIIRLIPVHQ